MEILLNFELTCNHVNRHRCLRLVLARMGQFCCDSVEKGLRRQKKDSTALETQRTEYPNLENEHTFIVNFLSAKRHSSRDLI
jgi:hypothetical protein